MPRSALLLAVAANVADLLFSWSVIGTYGLRAESNPLNIAFSLGLLGGVAWKAALLAVVFAAAALNPRHQRLLVGAVTAAGVVGAISALIAIEGVHLA